MPDAQRITTDRQVAGLKAREKPYEVTIPDTRGLIVRVFPTGARSFELRYVSPGGSRRRLPLGPYPGLSLAKAREKAQALRVKVVDGVDPAEERAAARTLARTGETLSELAQSYFEAAEKGRHGGRKKGPKRASTIVGEQGRFRTHIEPALGAMKVREITRKIVRGFAEGLLDTEASRGGKLRPDYVASIGGTLSSILAYAVHTDVLETNPAAGVARPAELHARERLFDEAALAALWRALTAPPGRMRGRPEAVSSEPTLAVASESAISLALRFALVTLARRGEIAGARWAEVSLKERVWRIPQERAKAGRMHVVPLSEPALAILAEAARLGGAEFVFVSPMDPSRHVSEHALTRQVTRLCKRHKLPHGSPHDARRSGATTMTGTLGVSRFVVSHVLGHAALDGAAVTGRHYDMTSYLPEKRAALDAWGSHILALAKERSTENVFEHKGN